MSSPRPFVRGHASSSAAGDSSCEDAGLRKSRFTYRHLSQLASYVTTCPLRVIAHCDLDAFYAQCEMARLGVARDKPLAVQQWAGLIAVNYPARAFGIGRHCTVTEAKKLCPDLIAQHVATWREGDDKWAYHDDAAANIATHKVSLDPYRLESRKILALIQDHLPPPPLQKVEKASIDEVFLDLSAHVHSVLLERFPAELAGPPPYDDPTERLPLPPISTLDWKADALVDLDETGADAEMAAADPDWDDVAMLIGSEIMRGVRAAVRDALGYTCSAGVACNKMLSKLGSSHRKPDQQTVIRNRAVQHFLSSLRFTQIRNLGGKLGEQVSHAFGTEDISALLSVPLDQIKAKLPGSDEGTAVWLYNTLRGSDNFSEVNPRTRIKSMLSAKSFRPAISLVDQAHRWLRIFTADIFSRLVEEGVLERRGGRRPRTINLLHRFKGQTRSRSMPIPLGNVLDQDALFDLARTLLGQIVPEGQVWPCQNLSLSVTGFEDGAPTGNMGIGAFLVKGEEARMLRANGGGGGGGSSGPSPGGTGAQQSHSDVRDGHAAKRRRLDNGGASGGIQRFFARQDVVDAQLGSHGATRSNRKNDGGRASGGETLDKVERGGGLGEDHEHDDYDWAGTGHNSAEEWLDDDAREAILDEVSSPPLVPGEPLSLQEPHQPNECQPNERKHYRDVEGYPQSRHPQRQASPAPFVTVPPFLCLRCDAKLDEHDEDGIRSHYDGHLARDLQEEENRRARPALAGTAGGGGGRSRSSGLPGGPKPSSTKTPGRPRRNKLPGLEPGQSKLNFG